MEKLHFKFTFFLTGQLPFFYIEKLAAVSVVNAGVPLAALGGFMRE